MSHSQMALLEAKLSHIPPGQLLVDQTDSPAAPTPSIRLFDDTARGRLQRYPLFPGIELSFLELLAPRISLSHPALDSVLEINFCRFGRTGWEMAGGNTLYLGPGDFSVHTMTLCAHSEMSLPLGYFEGATIQIDLERLRAEPPSLLQELGVTDRLLRDRFCGERVLTTFSAGEKKSAVFSSLFDVPLELRPGYYKLKVQELLLCLTRLPCRSGRELNQYQAQQVETIKEIHDYLMANLDRRISIEALSRQYLMNTTTLKSLFKTVYGSSIAAHIKEHRMERAAALLRETQESVAEIARCVGYESQSKFTAAFKEIYGSLPTAFRKGPSTSA